MTDWADERADKLVDAYCLTTEDSDRLLVLVAAALREAYERGAREENEGELRRVDAVIGELQADLARVTEERDKLQKEREWQGAVIKSALERGDRAVEERDAVVEDVKALARVFDAWPTGGPEYDEAWTRIRERGLLGGERG